MFSGKTSELIRRIHRYELCNYKCVIIRYARDNRYSATEVSTHDGYKIPALSANMLQEVEELFSSDSSPNVIGVDEGQFVSLVFMYIFIAQCYNNQYFLSIV